MDMDDGADMKKLSPTQVSALRDVVTRFDDAVARELKNWGAASAAKVAVNGVDESPDFALPTMNALIDRGMVTFTSHHGEHNSLRRGAYGRWIGGSVTRHFATRRYVPTEKGRVVISSTIARAA